MSDLHGDGVTFRQATVDDIPALVALYDGAARWMQRNGIDQWKPGQKSADHFLLRMKEGEVWLAHAGGAAPVGGWEVWWDDEPAWGPQPPVAGYIHRLMTDRTTAPPNLGRAMLTRAEHRIAATGRTLSRLDCVSTNPRLRAYYESAGYTVTGEQPLKDGGGGSRYAVTLLEKRLVS
ncbi:GNAT family N-acetyltransferase [Streptomyces sp. SPB162]|uniref:GNAT family N-acetyltransferase n=1 Tax=Streptomyces sp. SPB162 TaxID=2940560 RepID=UPI002404B4EB|nr:GNAT family N-acetyltransferase [Streptomyces sp. SPB162]